MNQKTKNTMTSRFHQLSLVIAMAFALALPALPADLFDAGADNAQTVTNGLDIQGPTGAAENRTNKNNRAAHGTQLAH